MKTLKLLIILITTFFNVYSYAVIEKNITIFVHGTKGISRHFFKYSDHDNKLIDIKEIPKSYTSYKIAQSLKKNDPNNFDIEYFYVFGWPGELEHKARVKAAKNLYDEILKLIKNLNKKNIKPIINFITHSHGGNVALNLANVCSEINMPFQINNLILLACPVQEQTCKLIKSKMFKNIYNIYSESDYIQILDMQGRHPENKNKDIPLLSQRNFKPCPKLKQIQVKIDNWGPSHADFISPKFCDNLPDLLKKINELPKHSEFNIQTK